MKDVLLSINNVNLELTGLSRPILKSINYDIYEGDFIVLLGHNGSGKSSLLKILDRRYRATSGQALLQGKRIESYSESQLAKLVVTLTQNYQGSLFSSLTVLENCILVRQSHASNLLGISIAKEKIFFANYLGEFNQNLANKLDLVVTKLSGGEQQALALALNVLYPPKILLLDEHTSALDPQAAVKLMAITSKMVQKHGITCIMATHDLDLALNYGDRILALASGEVVQSIGPDQKENLNIQDLLRMCY